MSDEKPQSLKKQLYQLISMQTFTPDQGKVREALGVQQHRHGGNSDRSVRVPQRPGESGRRH